MKRPGNPVFRVMMAPDIESCRKATEVLRRDINPLPMTEEAFLFTVTRRRWDYDGEIVHPDDITLIGHLSGFSVRGPAVGDPDHYVLYIECAASEEGWKMLGLPTKKFAIVITDFGGNTPLKGYVDENDSHSQPA